MIKVGIPMNFGPTCGIGSSYFTYFSETLEGIVDDGVEIILLPPNHSMKKLNLLVLPGGADVLPSRYGGIPKTTQGYADPIKEYFDSYWLPKYISAGTPIFGICRGHQSLCAFFGGKLQETYHDTNDNNYPGKEMHKVYPNREMIELYKGSLFSEMIPRYKMDAIGVNSRHHQGYSVRNSGDMVPLLLDSTRLRSDAIVEAAAHPTLPIVSVQWHPEDLYDSFTSIVVEHLVSTQKSILSVLS